MYSLILCLIEKDPVDLTLAALTALTFSSISTKATLTFSELSWRLYFTAGKSCSSNGWLNLLSKSIGRHYKEKGNSSKLEHKQKKSSV